MKKQLITTLMMLIACSALSACAEEQAAKAAVDIKAAATSRAANAKTAATGQKPAAAKPAAAAPATAKEPAAAPKAAAKAAASASPDAAKAAGAPASTAAKVPPAPAAGKVPAVPTADAGKSPNVPASPAGAAKTPEAAVKVEEPPPALSVPAGYRYEPRGRRDPFINPVPRQQVAGTEQAPVPLNRPDGLPGVLVSEVKLSGIVHSADKEMNKAMLVVGRNTYFAKKGDSLFDGVIKEIRPNEVVFAMVSASTRKPMNRDTVVRTGGSSGTSAGEKK